MYDPTRYNPAARFTGLSKLYTTGRPSYPTAAINHIVNRCQLTNDNTIVDVGCGTGISTRVLASMCQLRLCIIGIDPNEDMLCEANQIATDRSEKALNTSICYRKGSAEHTGLEPEIADAVICAQSFHWFNPNNSLQEFHRILKPTGHVVLMWNERCESDFFTMEYGKLMTEFGDTTCYEVKRAESADVLFETDLFADATVSRFENEQRLDRDKLMARVFSTSYAPRAGTDDGARLLSKLDELFSHTQVNGQVTMRYQCSVYSAAKI